jgi:hypothetical protein
MRSVALGKKMVHCDEGANLPLLAGKMGCGGKLGVVTLLQFWVFKIHNQSGTSSVPKKPKGPDARFTIG